MDLRLDRKDSTSPRRAERITSQSAMVSRRETRLAEPHNDTDPSTRVMDRIRFKVNKFQRMGSPQPYRITRRSPVRSVRPGCLTRNPHVATELGPLIVTSTPSGRVKGLPAGRYAFHEFSGNLEEVKY